MLPSVMDPQYQHLLPVSQAGDNITVSGSTGSVTITGIGTADIDTDRINVSGVVTASSFSGSGVNLTNLPAAVSDWNSS